MEGTPEFRGLLFALILALQAPPPEEVAKRIEESVRADGAWLDKSFDLDALFARSLKDAPGDPRRKAGFATGVRKSFNLGRKTAEAARGGSYRLLRIRTVDGKPRPLFRMISDGGLNYQEYLLEDSRIVDVYPYIQGEWMSETLRRLCTVALASDPAGGGLKDNEYMKNLPAIQKMTALQNAGKSAEALAVYAALPAALRKEKSLLIARYQMASEVGEKEALEAVEEMKKHHPGDPSLSLLSMGPYADAGRFDAALEAVDALEKATGGDPYLHVRRLEIHAAAGALGKARAAGLKAIELEKTLEDAHWGMVTVSMKEKKFAETAAWLTTLEKEFKAEFQDLSKVEAYADFVKSPEYAAWMKARGK